MPGGRLSHSFESKITRFKELAWQRIITRCEKNKKELDKYIQMFSNRLIPTDLKVTNTNEKEYLKIEKALILLTGIKPDQVFNLDGQNSDRNSQDALQRSERPTLSLNGQSVGDMERHLQEAISEESDN